MCAVQNKTKVDTHVFITIHCKIHIFHALLKYFGLKIYRNEHQMDNNGNTGSDIEVTKLVLQYSHVPM